ncbi:MAG: DUF3025 domain-containing protein [Burkholderiaceae bacterium]|nr:DUF3025 domain-containing protein [Rhodoferax sp.]MCB2027835.1 DUF3025 domain-containing protein [Rhodoferax sp.]MCP5262885.1 DUF3025 domain-containing protein [Rhodoferax sp.]
MRHTGEAVMRSVRTGMPLWQALNQAAPAPVRFVPQSALPEGMAYEQFIADTGTCPTREGLHDFFNGLCWIHFPATKRRLNRLQAAQIAADGVQPVRGPVRDALTVLDENAAFLSAPAPLWEALRDKRWEPLFGPLRPLWQQARLVLFGHALLEKLCMPRKAITAHVFLVPLPAPSPTEMDDWVAGHLQADLLATKPFAHLPVLGVPGWWPANDVPDFYRDTTVFRPARQAAAAVSQ